MRIFRGAAVGIALGVGVAAVTAFADILVRWIHPSIAFSRSSIWAIYVLYTVIWAMAGLILGIGLSLFIRERLHRILFLLLSIFSTGIILGGYANLFWLPSLLDLRSLLADAGLLVLMALLAGFAWAPLGRLDRRPAIIGSFLSLAIGGGLAFALSVVSPGDAGKPTAQASEGPDILVVLLDALRADHCSIYGYPRPTTPTLESVAPESAIFENAYSQSSWTKPSVATIFTGLYPASHGNHRINSRLPADALTVPQMLREAGYRTGVFAENSFVSPLFGYDRGVERMVTAVATIPSQTILGHLLQQLAVRSGFFDRVLQLADASNRLDPRRQGHHGEGLDLPASFLGWVDEIGDDPFFAYVHFMKPHAPYICPPSFDGIFGEPSGPDLNSRTMPPHVEGIAPFAVVEQPSPEDRIALVDNYDERIRYGDSLVAQILEGLRQRERWQDTVLLVIADHGEEFGEHGLFDHGHSLQEGVIRVPFLLRDPKRTAPGRRIDTRIRLLDVGPTLLDAAGLAPNDQFDGRSVLQLLEDPGALDRPALSELEHGPAFGAQSLVSGDLKLVRSRSGNQRATRLFDLIEDPQEDRDLATALADTLPELELLLMDALEAAASRQSESGSAILDPQTEERLRALGYI